MDSASDPTIAPWSHVSTRTGAVMTVTTEDHEGTPFAMVSIDGKQLFGLSALVATGFARAVLKATGSTLVVAPPAPKNIRTDTAIPPTLAELHAWAWTGRPAAAQAARLLGHQYGGPFRPRYDTATDLWFIEAGS